MRVALLWAVVAACAQATGTQQQVQQDASTSGGQHDAAVSHPMDAPKVVPMDARPLDAFVYKDAPAVLGGEGDFCSGNDQCGSGLCCYIAVCVAGTPFGSLCFPDGN
ncbi:MAG: hypothetical protein QM831_46150 [Kofleriaceae bacterium]